MRKIFIREKIIGNYPDLSILGVSKAVEISKFSEIVFISIKDNPYFDWLWCVIKVADKGVEGF